MELIIDVTSPVHQYLQIADQLRAAIGRGEYDDAFPSLWEIVRMTESPDRAPVAYNTARRAVDVLKKEGLIVAVPGRGTFVRRDGGQ